MVKHRPAALDAVFTALAHPTRRALLQSLARRRSSPTELAEPFDVSLAAVSKHLSVLERAGLIGRRREGRTNHLFIIAGPLEAAAAWLGEQKGFWERQLDALERFLDETSRKEEISWRHRSRVPASRSGSPGASRIRVKRSSRRGPIRSG